MGAKGCLARRMLNFITGARSPPRLWRCEKRRAGVLLRIGRFRPRWRPFSSREERGRQRKRHRLMNFSLIG